MIQAIPAVSQGFYSMLHNGLAGMTSSGIRRKYPVKRGRNYLRVEVMNNPQNSLLAMTRCYVQFIFYSLLILVICK